MRINEKLIRAILGAVALAILVFGVALAAASITLLQYQLDFIEVTKEGDISTWTYAVTASGDESMPLDLWSLKVDKACGYIVESPDESFGGERTYTTLTAYALQQGPDAGVDICAGTYDCQAASYSVYHGYDTITSLFGIKFYNSDLPLSSANPGTHVFQVQVAKPDEHRTGDAVAGVAVGGAQASVEKGPLTGPVCAPTAVSLVGFKGVPPRSQAGLGLALIVVSVLTLAGMLLTDRIRTSAARR